MIESMAQIHMTEAEVARNFAAALEKLRQGIEVVVEHDHQPAVPPHRRVSEVLALTPNNSSAAMDASFTRDIEAAIESHRMRSQSRPLISANWRECRQIFQNNSKGRFP